MPAKHQPREHWTSSLGFILAATGSAIGLGNIWKFPYITGANGGGAFVLVYLLCILAIGIPVMICEITLGRHTQRNPAGAFNQLTPPSSTLAHLIGLGVFFSGMALICMTNWGWGALLLIIGVMIFRYSWRLIGCMGVLAGFLILSFYSVVAGWTLGYVVEALTGRLAFGSVTEAEAHFTFLSTHRWWPIVCHLVFVALCVKIVMGGVRAGIERWSRILMPTLFVLLILLTIRSISLPGASAGVRFYLSPDFSRITANGILTALGMAFFSLSLGMGAIITYGSYMGKHENIFTCAVSITVLDTAVALLAGLAIFPAVFAQGFDPEAGPGLVFLVLPTVFNSIALGPLWASLFFLLLLIAALTSGISLLEVVTAYFVDERHWSRRRATLLCAAVIFATGTLCAVSTSDWQRLVYLQKLIIAIFGAAHDSFFALMDNIASNWLLPLGGLFISIFTGWVWGSRHAVNEIRDGSHNFADVHLLSLMAGLKDDPPHNTREHVLTLAALWGVFIRLISPVAVLLAFLHTIGWLDFKPPPTPEPASPSLKSKP